MGNVKELGITDFVDIVIPVYNVEKYLPLCLDSIVRQTYKNINVYLVDDGSTDNSGTICDQYASNFKNVFVIHQKNMGLSGARNTGISASKAMYICFLDSDDWIDTNTIEILMKNLIKSQADVVCCSSIDEYTENGICFKNEGSYSSEVYSGDTILRKYLERKINTSAWGKIFKRELFSQIRFPVGKLHEDLAIMIDLLTLCDKVAFVSAPLWHYRQRIGSITKQHYKHANFDLYHYLQHIKEKLDGRLPREFEGFYAFYLKSLLVMFNPEDKVTYKEDYSILNRELKRLKPKIIFNASIKLKDKISILFATNIFHSLIKKIYFKILK